LPGDGRPVFVWSQATGWRDLDGNPPSGVQFGQPEPQKIAQEILDMPEESIFVLKDFGHYLQAKTFSYFDVVSAWLFDETLSPGSKPLQVYAAEDVVRSIHGASYTRLFNVDLLTMVREFATDFVPPQKAGDGSGESDGGTGLYCGEQDMFCFLIDPTGWAEVNGEAFAPGFFVWNSEVGKRSVGVQTFWFQAVCQNHIVWGAVEVVDFSRKHTANVYESMADSPT
jgi:hypothetical protein